MTMIAGVKPEIIVSKLIDSNSSWSLWHDENVKNGSIYSGGSEKFGS